MLSKRRVQLQGFALVSVGLEIVAGPQVGQTPAPPGHGQVRVDLDGVRAVGDHLLGVAPGQGNGGAVGVGRGQLGVQLDGVGEVFQALCASPRR